MELKVTSEFGVVRDITFTNSKEIGDIISKSINEDKMCLFTNIHVDKKGCIQLLTKHHYEWHLVRGGLLCIVCGRVFKGQRGLRVHQVINHGIEYGEAAPKAKEADLQIVQYITNKNILIEWERDAIDVKKEKSKLDEGMEIAKNGDIEGLKILIHKGYDVNNSVDRNGSTCLSWASGGSTLSLLSYSQSLSLTRSLTLSLL